MQGDAHVVLWWASPVECQSALHRAHHAGTLPVTTLREALARLSALVEDFDVIAPTSRVRERAGRLVAAHPLRAADALQLAAALAWCDEAPRGNGFVCLDERLCVAARTEGFAVLPT
jgi:predicted nucleic acid-binding protein